MFFNDWSKNDQEIRIYVRVRLSLKAESELLNIHYMWYEIRENVVRSICLSSIFGF